jgi:hypothetical protein
MMMMSHETLFKLFVIVVVLQFEMKLFQKQCFSWREVGGFYVEETKRNPSFVSIDSRKLTTDQPKENRGNEVRE